MIVTNIFTNDVQFLYMVVSYSKKTIDCFKRIFNILLKKINYQWFFYKNIYFLYLLKLNTLKIYYIFIFYLPYLFFFFYFHFFLFLSFFPNSLFRPYVIMYWIFMVEVIFHQEIIYIMKWNSTNFYVHVWAKVEKVQEYLYS